MDQQGRRVPFTFMFVAAFLVLVGVGLMTNRHVMKRHVDNLTMQ